MINCVYSFFDWIIIISKQFKWAKNSGVSTVYNIVHVLDRLQVIKSKHVILNRIFHAVPMYGVYRKLLPLYSICSTNNKYLNSNSILTYLRLVPFVQWWLPSCHRYVLAISENHFAFPYLLSSVPIQMLAVIINCC